MTASERPLIRVHTIKAKSLVFSERKARCLDLIAASDYGRHE